MNKQQEIRLFDTLDKIKDDTTTLKAQMTIVHEILPKHEIKIEALETYRDKTSGIVIVLGAILGIIASAITAVVVNIFGGHK